MLRVYIKFFVYYILNDINQVKHVEMNYFFEAG